MKRILFVVFFSLVYSITPIMALADTDQHEQEQIATEEHASSELLDNQSSADSKETEGDQADAQSADQNASTENMVVDENTSTSTDEVISENETASSTSDVETDGVATSTEEQTVISRTSANNSFVNHLPQFFGPTNVSTHVGSSVEFVVTATDEDGNPDAEGHVVNRHQEIPEGATFDVASGLFSWTPAAVGNYLATFTAFDGTGTSTHIVAIEVLSDELPNCSVNGLYGTYYNLPANHPDVERTITGIATGTTPLQFDWYSDTYRVFARNDGMSTFNIPANYFPVDTGLDGDPFYFAVHWHGGVFVPTSTSYAVTLKTDDDSWLYVNGELMLDAGGVHELDGYVNKSIQFSAGTSTIDLYFAERHTVQSGIVFSINGARFSPCVENVPEENLPPEFVNFNPPTVATSTEQYSYDVDAVDPENDPLEFSLIENPDGMSIATSTGIISWIPTLEQATTTPYSVIVAVSDPTHTATTSYSIIVEAPHNHLPIINAPDHVSGTTGKDMTFEVTTSDPDGDVVTLRYDLPGGASFATSTFSWKPANAGSYTATFTASDGIGTSTHIVAIEITTPSSGGGGTTPPPPPPSGGGGGGGGGGGSNGPPIPISLPVPPSYTTPPPVSGGGGSNGPPVNTPVSNVPSQPTPVPPPAEHITPPAGESNGVSLTPTTTHATTTTAAGGRTFGDALLAGLFNLIDWLRANWCIIGWILFIITLITFILYVIFSKEDHDDELKSKKSPLVPPAPPEGIMFQNSSSDLNSDSATAEYWQTQEKE